MFKTICILIFVGFLIYENYYLKIKKIKYKNIKIKNDLNGFRILQISDYHNKRFLTKNYFINKIKNTKPNIIVITGDIINSRNPNYDIVDIVLNEIVKLAPIYYITGNHEKRLDDFYKFITKMKEIGVVVLEDERETIEIKKSKINIIGVNDISYFGKDYLINKVENLKKDDELNILLSHRPELFKEYASINIELVLSGHTHGGQIKIPFIGALYVPSQGFFPKYVDGIYKEKDTTMVISKGIGSSLIPLRLFSNPELILLELEKT